MVKGQISKGRKGWKVDCQGNPKPNHNPSPNHNPNPNPTLQEFDLMVLGPSGNRPSGIWPSSTFNLSLNSTIWPPTFRSNKVRPNAIRPIIWIPCWDALWEIYIWYTPATVQYSDMNKNYICYNAMQLIDYDGFWDTTNFLCSFICDQSILHEI